MKRFLAILLSLCLFTFAGCTRYISSYSAVGFVRSTKENCGEMSFKKFKGRYVFKLKANIDGSEGCVAYNAVVTEGDGFTVYYDAFGLKEKLFDIGSNDSATARGGYIERGRIIYIIVESNGDGFVGGYFSFELTSQLA